MKKKKTKEEKIRLLSSVLFLLVGLAVGLVSLFINGWDLKSFVTNPTVMLILLLLFTGAILSFSIRIGRG